jgi:hypothetical protein
VPLQPGAGARSGGGGPRHGAGDGALHQARLRHPPRVAAHPGQPRLPGGGGAAPGAGRLAHPPQARVGQRHGRPAVPAASRCRTRTAAG